MEHLHMSAAAFYTHLAQIQPDRFGVFVTLGSPVECEVKFRVLLCRDEGSGGFRRVEIQLCSSYLQQWLCCCSLEGAQGSALCFLHVEVRHNESCWSHHSQSHTDVMGCEQLEAWQLQHRVRHPSTQPRLCEAQNWRRRKVCVCPADWGWDRRVWQAQLSITARRSRAHICWSSSCFCSCPIYCFVWVTVQTELELFSQ